MPTMTLKTRIAATVTAAACLIGLGTTAASAETPSTATPPVGNTIVVTQNWRALAPLSDEQVPAYQCPASHPYLLDQDYAPFGTTLLPGVEIEEEGTPWPIGVSITGPRSVAYPEKELEIGVFTGISDAPLASSAMNWTFWATQKYRVILHCTDAAWQAANDVSYVVKPPRAD